MYEIILFDVHHLLNLIIIIFCVDIIKNDYLWRIYLLNI